MRTVPHGLLGTTATARPDRAGLPTDTLVGVETRAEPGYLIEVDAIAVVG